MNERRSIAAGADSNERNARTGGFRFAVATLFSVGAISTLTQMIAVATLGLPVRVEWSTGGLVALIASIWMWIQCRSWATWRRWIWLPIAITIVLAFVTINFMAASARATAEREAEAAHAEMCSAAEADLVGMIERHEALVRETWELQITPFEMRDGWLPRPDDGTSIDWALGPTQAEIWDYYVSFGGPQMETDIAEFEAAVAAECTSTSE